MWNRSTAADANRWGISCPNCGAKNDSGKSSCFSCGKALNASATASQQRAGCSNIKVINLSEVTKEVTKIKKQIAQCEKQLFLMWLIATLVGLGVSGILYWGFDMRKRWGWWAGGFAACWGLYTLLGGPEVEKRKKDLEKELKTKCKWR